MKRKKHLWVIILTALFAAILIAALSANLNKPSAESSNYAHFEDYFEFEINNGKATLVSFRKQNYSAKVEIPSEFDGCPVTGIGKYAFSDCEKIPEIKIPDSVTIIDKRAFVNCKNLSKIVIPDSVISIGEGAFSDCESLKEIVFSKSLRYIGYFAFENCVSLSEIVIPDSVTDIKKAAFYNCKSLSKITIPDSLVQIGSGAFYETPWYDSQPDGLVYIGKVLLDHKGNCPSDITIIDGTKGIGDYALSNAIEIRSVSIPDTVSYIGYGAFYGCSGIEEITIPDNVSTIKLNTFSGCKNLKNVNLPDSVKQIGESAFSGCSNLRSIKLPESLEFIDEKAFSSCDQLKDIVFSDSLILFRYINAFDFTAWLDEKPDGIVYAGKNVLFYKGECPSTVRIEDGTLSIAPGAFFNCTNLSDIVVPDSVVSIGVGAFSVTAWNNNLTDGPVYLGKVFYRYKGECPETFTIENGTKEIAASAFSGCSDLKSVVIPESVISIGYHAFRKCAALEKINIPSSVKSIDDYAFEECTNLKEIAIPSSVTRIGENVFENCDELTVICEKGSYAEEYCIINSIGFTYPQTEANEESEEATSHTALIIAVVSAVSVLTAAAVIFVIKKKKPAKPI